MNLENKEKHLVIRSVTKADLPFIWELSYQNHLEWRDWNGPYFNDPVFSWQEFEKFWLTNYVGQDDAGIICLDNQPIGEISWHWEDGNLQHWLEFGLPIYAGREWSKGIGTAASALWLDYLFALFPEIPHVGFTTWSGNKRMIGVGEKLGMRQEACIRKVRFYKDRYYDSIKYGILSDEWLNSSKGEIN